MDNNCMYCTQDERLSNLMIYICDLKFSKLYLFKDQTHYGRCVLACKKHVKEMYELSEEEISDYSLDLAKASKAIAKAVSPAKINFGVYGDKVSHFHCHIVPKSEDAPNFGGTFEMRYEPPKILSDAEYNKIIEAIKENL